MELIYKYPRTRHIEGSRIQTGDEDLKCQKFEGIKGRYMVLEEKVDGANCGISFGADKRLRLQSRGHYLNGGYGEKQFDLFKLWANCFQAQLYQLLGTRYVMYGEWLYAKHTVFYDELTHYFMEFDIYDREKKMFLSTKKRKEMLSGYPFLVSVLVLYEGYLTSREMLTSYLGKSHFKSPHFQKTLEGLCKESGLDYGLVKCQTDSTDLMEGIYIKIEDENQVVDRLKYVRSSFLNTILDSETHWVNRPVIPNQLKAGVDLFSQEVVL